MRAECVRAVQIAATAIGKSITTADIQGIEGKIYQARKELAKKDITAYRNLTVEEQLNKAGESVIKQAIHDATVKRQRAELTVKKAAEREIVLEKIMSQGHDRLEAVRRYNDIVSDGKGSVIPLESKITGIGAHYWAELQTGPFAQLQKESTFAGIQYTNKHYKDYVSESYGIDSGNKLAKDAYQQVSKVYDKILAHVNRVGGDIPKLENYRNPQALDTFNVSRNGGKQGVEFVKDMMDWVDREMYVNADGTMMSDIQLQKFLREAHITVVTDGASKQPGQGTGSVANRNKAHRQIHYKSPEAYMAAMEKYGNANMFENIRGHVDSLSRDIALMEHWGPNSIHEFNKTYSDAAHETGRTDPRVIGAFERMSGQTKMGNIAAAYYMQQFRSVFTASRLGSMAITQLADQGTTAAVASQLRISYGEILKYQAMLAASPDARSIMRSDGVGIEAALDAVTRLAGDATFNGFFGKMASIIPTVQGANLMTSVARQGVGASLQARWGDIVSAHNKWADVPDREIYEKLGVTEQDFNIWKMATPDYFKGAKMLNARVISDIDPKALRDALGLRSVGEAEAARQDASIRFASMVIEQTHTAVLQPSVESQILFSGGTAGTFSTELTKTVMQFKSYPWAYLRQLIGQRAYFDEKSGYSPAIWRAKLIAGTSIMGGVALMLGDLAQGKEPPDFANMDDKQASMWAFKAIAKGGGLSFFTDAIEMFMGGDKEKAAQMLVGPGIGWAAEAGVSAAAGVKAAGSAMFFDGDEKAEKLFAKTAYNSIKGATPGQNLWMLRGFLHNVILDDVQEEFNPGYKERAIQREQDQYGRGYWLGME